MNIKFQATDESSDFIPSTSSVRLTEDAVSSLIGLRVIIIIPLHMRTNSMQVSPLLQAIPQYKMLTGRMANVWKNFTAKNSFTVGGINDDFSSIQTCLDAVPTGSLITVYPGLYNETVAITKPVTLVGAPDTFLTSTVILSASHVTLDGFTFKSSPRNQSLLRIEGSHVHIQNCKFIGQHVLDQPIGLDKVEPVISCYNCYHVKLLNNLFSHCMFALSLEKVKHFTVRSNVFSYGYISMVVQRSANVHVLGNLFEFNRAIAWLDNSLEAVAPSFADNAYYNNLQSDVCLQYQDQITQDQESIYLVPKFGELKDLECHHLNILSTANTTARDIMTPPDHVVFKAWCSDLVDEKQAADIPGIEDQIYTQSGCILLLSNVVATVYPQGTLIM